MVEENFLDRVFRKGRSQNGWLDEPVSDEQLKQVYELMKWCPTSVNCSLESFSYVVRLERRN